MRERWVTTPLDWVTAAHLSPAGDRVVLTARGQLFVAPVEQGRLVEATRNSRVRYRERAIHARRQVAARPLGRVRRGGVLARAGQRHRPRRRRSPPTARCCAGTGCPRPTASRIAHYDKDQQLWVLDVATKKQTKLAFAGNGDFDDLAWSPDSRFLAYTAARRQHADAHLPVGGGDRAHRAGDLGPLRQRAARPGAATASGSTSSPTATSSRSSAAPGDRGSPSRSTTSRRASTTSRWCRARARRSSRPTSCIQAEKKDDEKKDDEKKGDRDEGRRRRRRKATRRRTSRTERAKSAKRSQVDLTDLVTRLIEVPVPRRQLRQPVGGRQAPLRPRPRHRAAIQARAQDAGASTRTSPSSRRFSTTCGATSCRPTARRCWCGARRTTSCSTARAKAPAGRRAGQEGAAAWRLAVPARPAQRVAPDVHRGVAPRARLLLRPPDARRGLAGVRAKIRAAGGSRHRSRRALRRPRADGERAVGAAHLRLRRRRADRQRRRRAGVARGANGRATPRPAATASRTSTRSDPDLPDELSPLRRPGVGVEEGDVDHARQRRSDRRRRRARPVAARPGRQAGAARRHAQVGRRTRRPSSCPSRDRATRTCATTSGSTRAGSKSERASARPHRLRAPARDGRAEHRRVDARVLPRLRPRPA